MPRVLQKHETPTHPAAMWPHGVRPLRVANFRGLTLPEVLIASVILSVAAIAVTKAVATGHQVTYAALNTERAMALAEALMEEVLSMPVDDPQGQVGTGPDNAETERALFDNQDDFDGYQELTDTLADRSGTLYPALYQGFQRDVTVVSESVDLSSMGALAGQRITVSVTEVNDLGVASGRAYTIDRFVPIPEDDE